MIRLRDLLGQDAVSLATAERTGRVTGVRVDGGRVTAVAVDKAVIDARSVRSFEGDVLTFDGTLGDAAAAANTPIGRRVLDSDGDELGEVEDLEIEADGTVSALVLSDGRRLDGRLLGAIGSYAAIVSRELPPPTGPPVA